MSADDEPDANNPSEGEGALEFDADSDEYLEMATKLNQERLDAIADEPDVRARIRRCAMFLHALEQNGDGSTELLGAANFAMRQARRRKAAIDNEKKHGDARVASIDFCIDERYVGSRDLRMFCKRVDDLFEWHGSSSKPFLRPTFPSSNQAERGKRSLCSSTSNNSKILREKS
jgi:hypothetical protein